jgi:hypothetical protein
VPDNEKYQSAVPVYDLAVAAGGFSEAQAPEPKGWAKVHTGRLLDKQTFVARVVGHSMEDGIPDGSWGLFRMWSAGAAPSPTALDGRRVVVQLRDETDPDTGGQYTLKRWKVTRVPEQDRSKELHRDGDVVQDLPLSTDISVLVSALADLLVADLERYPQLEPPCVQRSTSGDQKKNTRSKASRSR